MASQAHLPGFPLNKTSTLARGFLKLFHCSLSSHSAQAVFSMPSLVPSWVVLAVLLNSYPFGIKILFLSWSLSSRYFILPPNLPITKGSWYFPGLTKYKLVLFSFLLCSFYHLGHIVISSKVGNNSYIWCLTRVDSHILVISLKFMSLSHDPIMWKINKDKQENYVHNFHVQNVYEFRYRSLLILCE